MAAASEETLEEAFEALSVKDEGQESAFNRIIVEQLYEFCQAHPDGLFFVFCVFSFC
jgi:hypothetical protein